MPKDSNIVLQDIYSVEYVPQWDGIKEKCYLIINKKTGSIITFGRYTKEKDYLEYNRRKLTAYYLKNYEALESRKNIEFRTIRKMTNFKAVRSNKILFGYDAQPVVHLRHTETGERRWIRGKSVRILNGKEDLMMALNTTIRKGQQASGDVWEIIEFYFEYYIPNDVNYYSSLKNSESFKKEQEDLYRIDYSKVLN